MDSSDKDKLREQLLRGFGKEASYEEKKKQRDLSRAKKAARERERPRRREFSQEDEPDITDRVKRGKRLAPASETSEVLPCDDALAGEQALVVGLERTSVRLRLQEAERDVPLAAGDGGLAVGDLVVIEDVGFGQVRLRARRSRRSTLSRPDPNVPSRQRVIAANLDQAVMVVSAKEPPFKPALVDRLLVAVLYGGVAPVLCVNKVDLLSEEERAVLHQELAVFRELNVTVCLVCANSGLGMEELRALLDGKRSVLVGHSGVGKTSLANALAPQRSRSIGAVRAKDKRGRHTTSSSALFEAWPGCELIDTPGVRQFGLFGIAASELASYFPEYALLCASCRFRDCSHRMEPGCAVVQAVERRELSATRYRVYRRLWEELG